MKYIVCAFALFVSGLCQGVTVPEVEMYPAGHTIIQEGSKLKLECQGNINVNITRMELVLKPNQKGQSVPEVDDRDPKNIVWTIPQATHVDTGWYACADARMMVDNNEQTVNHNSSTNIDWIYVTVNSTTSFAIITPNPYQYVGAVSGFKIIVPCRLSSSVIPSSAVELWRDENRLTGYEYDPKIGFIIEKFSIKEWHRRVAKCKTGMINSSNRIPTYELGLEEFKESPVIRGVDDKGLSIVGRNLTLTCEIKFPSNQMHKSLQLLPPLSARRSRMIDGEETKKCPENERFCKVTLTLPNLTKTDSGKYVCTPLLNAQPRNPTTKHITILDAPFLKCGEKNETDINAEAGKGNIDPVWTLNVESFHDPEFKWYKDGSEIELLSTYPTKYKSSSSGKKHAIEIRSASFADIGNYEVWVITPTNSCSYNLRYTLTGKPEAVIKPLSLSNSLSHYKPGVNANFICNGTGWPLPNVTWTFTEWPPEEHASKTLLSTVSDESLKEDSIFLESRLNMIIDRIGNLTCTVCNEVNCTEATAPILISDGNGAFGIVHPDPVTEGDNLSLMCAATHQSDIESVEWNQSNLEAIQQRIRVTPGGSKWTTQSILEIQDVKLDDSGLNYVCVAFGEDKKILETKDFFLKVHEKSKLFFLDPETTFNDTIVNIARKDKHHGWTLNCVVRGMPIPTVTWFADDERLLTTTTDGDPYKFIDNSTLRINYFSKDVNYSCVAENRIERIEKYMYFKVEGKEDNQQLTILVILICILTVIIIVVITYMGIKVQRERKLRKELLEAGLTHFEEGALECLNPDLTVDDQAELLPYDKKWEFPRENLKLGKQLGSGAFGVVMKAEARGICVEDEVTTVAVKMVRRTAEPSYMKALSSELKIMIHLGRHLNVVNLLGACTKNILTKRELFVIVEYCRFGNLYNYLQRQRSSFVNQIDPVTDKIDLNIGRDRLNQGTSINSRNRSGYIAVRMNSSSSNSDTELTDYRQCSDFEDISMSPDNGVLSDNSVQPGWRSNYRGDYKDQSSEPICTQDLLCWAWQVSRGMEYLSSRNVLHGDLAARNILLADDKIVKICDFGLAKNLYKNKDYMKKGDGPLPIKWMAIESIRDRIFSTQSDVWSFGIVLWEFFTLAQTPYPGLEAENQYGKLLQGYRMEKPKYATNEIYKIMKHCWKGKPSLRPDFPDLAAKIGALLDDSLRTHYTALDSPYINMNSEALANGQNDYLTMMSAPSHDLCYSSNRTLEMPPISSYVHMGSVTNVSDPGIFSPRSHDHETEFRFSPSSNNIPNNSDSQDVIETVAMVERDPERCDLRDFPNLNNQSSQEDTNFNETSTTKDIKNKNSESTSLTIEHDNYVNAPDISRAINIEPEDLTPPIIGSENYVNLPKKNLNPLIDGISNPNYTIMSALKERK